jgi:c(7)-type cytochrome triheme protein
MSSRCLLFIALLVCVSCGSAPSEKAEEKTPPAKVEQPKAEPLKSETAHVDTTGGSAPGVPPETIEFPSSYGSVTFTHKKHFDRVNGDCSTCHPKIFPQAREALNYGKARHRVAEEYKTSCATCHDISGTAFAAERNCQKCHDMSTKR